MMIVTAIVFDFVRHRIVGAASALPSAAEPPLTTHTHQAFGIPLSFLY